MGAVRRPAAEATSGSGARARTRRAPDQPNRSRMSNVAGKAYGFTAFTPMKRWKTPFVRLFFWSVPIFSLGIVQRLFGWIHLVKAQKLLLELSFIHFARWSIVKHNFWPRLSDQQPKIGRAHV